MSRPCALALTTIGQSSSSGDVVVVRPLVVAPADVHANPLGRDVSQRVVQHLDVERGQAQELVDAAVAIHRVPAHGEVRCVDLQEPAAGGDRLVLDAHRLGQRLQVGVLRRVEVVRLEQRDDPGRGRVHERLDRPALAHRATQVVEIGAQRFAAAGADLTDAARAGVLRGRAEPGQLLQDARELDQVLARLARRVAGETGQPIADVGGVGDLAHLSVAHHVDACGDLPPHDVRDGVGDGPARRAVVRDLTALAREEDVGDSLRAGQAADVGGEDAVGAGDQAIALTGRCCSRCDRRPASGAARRGRRPGGRR